MSQHINQVKAQMEKMKKVKDTAKPTIQQGVQQEIDESAKEMATQNAEHQKQTQELEDKKLANQINNRWSSAETKNSISISTDTDGWTLNTHRSKKANKNRTKKLINPIKNRWKTKSNISISKDRLNASNNDTKKSKYVFAEQEFTIFGENRQNFSGTIIQYFEVTRMPDSKCEFSTFWVGLSNGNIPDGKHIEQAQNYYDFGSGLDFCSLSGEQHLFEWPNGATKPIWKGLGDVVGCGLLLNPENELAIFFTGNGILMGKQIPISSPPFEHFFPTVNLTGVSVEANFGDNSAKPFKYDIKKCPGLVFK